MKSTIYRIGIALITILFSINISAQVCTYSGDDARWETRFKAPGVTGSAVQTMLSAADGYLYLAGPSTYGGESNARYLMRFDGSKYAQVGSFFFCTSCVPQFKTLAQDSAGNIYVGGYFEGAKNPDGTSVYSRNVIKWNIASSIWEPVGLGVGTGRVNTIAWNNDTLYVGGEFDLTYNVSDTFSVNNIALFSTITNVWDSLGSGVTGNTGLPYPVVNNIQVKSNGTALVAGGFKFAGGDTAYSVARWNPNTGWDNWGGGLPIDYISVPGPFQFGTGHALQYVAATGDVFATGYFGQISGSASTTVVRHFAKWNGTSWNLIAGLGVPSGFSGWTIPGLFYDSSTNEIYIGGNFYKYTNSSNSANEPVADKIVKYNVATGVFSELDQGITPSIPGYANTVHSITKFQGKIYAGGAFTDMNTTYGSNLASFDGTSWDNVGDGFSYQSGESLMAIGSDLYVGGLTGGTVRADGKVADDLVFWNEINGWTNLDLGLVSGSASNYNKIITATELIGDSIWFGGVFTGVGDTIMSRCLGVYNRTTGQIYGFGTGASGPSSTRIYDIQEFQGDVYVAGNFTGMDGVTVSNLIKYSNGVWSSIGTFSSYVYCLENAGDTTLFIGGRFGNVNSIANTSSLVSWDGTSFHKVGKGISGYNSRVKDMEMDVNGVLQIVGRLNNATQNNGTTISGVKYLLQFHDSMYYNHADLQITGSVSVVTTDSNGVVYFGGDFTSTSSSSVLLNSIGRWSLSQGVMGFGTGVNSSVSASYIDDIVEIALVDSFMYTIGGHTRLGLSQSSGFGRYLLEDSIPIIPDFTFSDTLSGCDSLVIDANLPDETVVWSTGDTAQTITADTSGVFYVTAFNTYGCVKSDTFYVQINPTPTSSLPDTLEGCEPLVVTADPGYALYDWSNGDSTQSITLLSDSNYLMLSLTSNEGCFKTFVYITEVAALPEVDLGPDSVFCGVTILDAQNNGATYLWNTGETTQTINADTTDDYSVTVTGTNTCSASDTVHITINGSPISSLPDTISGCTPLTVTADPGYANYLWSNGDTTQSTILLTDTTSLVLTLSTADGCSGSFSYITQVADVPSISLNDSTSDCSISTIGVASGYASYLWSTGEGTPNITVNTSNLYWIEVENTAGCTSSDTIYVTVHHPDSTIFAADSITGCNQVSVTIPNYYSGFVWSDGDNSSLTKTTTDTSNLWVEVTDSNDCVFADTVDLLVTGYTPDAIITHSFVGVHDTVSFMADAMQGAMSYSWSFGDGNTAQGQNVTHTYGQVGVFTVQLIVETNCGADTSNTEIEITVSGINNIENKKSISMYPNPVKNVMNIKSNNAQLERFEIYDFTGKRIMKGKLKTNKINVSNLPKASYFLMVYPKDGLPARIPFVKM